MSESQVEAQYVEDPSLVEQALAEHNAAGGENQSLSQDPVELAATLFSIYLPRYNQLVNGLSSNGMRRLLKKMVEFPLGDKERKATTKEEQETFAISQRLLEAKYIMIMSTYQQAAEEALDKQTKEAQANSTTEETKENANG